MYKNLEGGWLKTNYTKEHKKTRAILHTDNSQVGNIKPMKDLFTMANLKS